MAQGTARQARRFVSSVAQKQRTMFGCRDKMRNQSVTVANGQHWPTPGALYWHFETEGWIP
jgi:hypothetical protein